MNQLRPHFGTDGIRGNAENELTDDFVFALGQAISTAIFDEITKNKSDEIVEIIIGRDTRISGARIEKHMSDGLIMGGARVTSVGILPTPAISLNVEKQNVYACAITASHNPAEDNGIKVFMRGGTKTDEEFEAKIEHYLDIYLNSKTKVEVLHEFEVKDATGFSFDTYIAWLSTLFSDLSLNDVTVALDCANGASYETAPTIFEQLGAKVLAINTENNGVNINNKCGATHLESLQNFVKKSNTIDLAFAFDGDADRIVVVDEIGNVYDGDYILALLASEMGFDPRIVVATSMSNGALKQYLSTINYDFLETQVGDKNVAIGMAETGAKIGGEQSGHIIVTDYAPFGDGVLIALLISKIYASKKIEDETIKLSEMLNLFTPMVQLHEKVVVSNKFKAESSPKISDATQAHLEKLGEGSRIVIRPSGTENIVRIMVEASEKELAEKSMKDLISVVEEACKE